MRAGGCARDSFAVDTKTPKPKIPKTPSAGETPKEAVLRADATSGSALASLCASLDEVKPAGASFGGSGLSQLVVPLGVYALSGCMAVS